MSGDVIKTCQVLPPNFASALVALRGDSDRLNAALALAHQNGWTLTALASALGVTREAIRGRVARARLMDSRSLPAIPLPPRREAPPPKPPRKGRLTVPDDLAKRLREMHAVARTVNGGTDVNDPRRRVSEDLTAQLASLVGQGVTSYQLAKVLGVGIAAVEMRLRRHGYGEPYPSQRFLYERKKIGDTDTCKRGHPRSEFLRTYPSGRRYCAECVRLRGLSRRVVAS